MCGIVGYVGVKQAAPILLSGLSKLEYRGYDSAGLAVRDEANEHIEVVKAKGRLKNLMEMTDSGNAVHGLCGIGHTRWATHGEPSTVNAHPQYTREKRVVIVHNGIIENYQEIKESLLKKGYTFASQTDTEVAAALLDSYYAEAAKRESDPRARALDASDLKAKYLINIDSEEEGILTVSCAGACRMACTLPVTRAPFDGQTLRVRISGLAGGHSGEEIHKGRANANLLLGRALDEMSRAGALRLIRVSGGAKDNAIPREAEAVVRTGDAAALRRAAEALAAALRAEYHAADGHITVTVTETDDGLTPMDAASTERAITLLLCAPNGVVEMNMDVPGLVQTSLNLGRLTSDEASLRASFMIRSSINSQKNAVASRLARLAEALGGQTELDSDYSAWPYRPESPLRDRVAEVFYEQYGEKPRIAALHAGLECGILSGKLPELDCISLGPDLTDIHTPRERLHIASTERTWRLLLGTLKRLDA